MSEIQKTHHPRCYRYHPECAVAEVERLREQVQVARATLVFYADRRTYAMGDGASGQRIKDRFRSPIMGDRGRLATAALTQLEEKP